MGHGTSLPMVEKTYTTAQAAAMIGITRQTLYTWITDGKIDAPKLIELDKRLWTEADVENAQKFKGTLKHGPKAKKKK